MMGLKRNLLSEFSASTISEVSMMDSSATRRIQVGKSAFERRKRKRNATTATKIVPGDSLAGVLLAKENTMPLKARKGTRQVKEISSKNKKDANNQIPSFSVLMDLGANENVISKGIATKSTKHQKVKSDKNSKSVKNRRIRSSRTGSVLVCFDSGNRCGKSSGMKGKIEISQTRRAKPKKRGETNAKRVCLEDAVSKVDSLMTCLAETSELPSERMVGRARTSKKQTKIPGQRKKDVENLSNKCRPSVVKSTKAPVDERKAYSSRKRQVGGLGAFVGIAVGNTNPKNSRNGTCNIRRLVSPLKGDMKDNSLVSKSFRKKPSEQKKPPKQKLKTKADGAQTDSAMADKVPAVIIVSVPQQNERSHPRLSLDTIITMNSQANGELEASKVDTVTKLSGNERQQSLPSSEMSSAQKDSNETNQTSLIQPNQKKKKLFHFKFNVGTKFQKDFKSHGWLKGEVVGMDSVTGLYEVRYEDGDTEELEEYELERYTFENDGTTHAKSEETTNNLIDNKKDDDANNSEPKRRSSRISRKKDQPSPTKQEAPVRRSRQRSNESIRLLGTKQFSIANESRKSETNSSFRRSKRRRSQPDRLINADLSSQKKNPSSAILKTKRSSKESKAEAKQRCTANNTPPGMDNAEGNIENEKTDRMIIIQDRPPSPSNRNKELFDDALKAVMPAGDCDRMQDDIFNSTPMRKLFERRLSSSIETNVSNQSEERREQAERRSKRKSIEPDRYGYDSDYIPKSSKKNPKSNVGTKASKIKTKSDAQSKCTKANTSSVSASKSSKKETKSAIRRGKRNTKGNSKAKKRVRISIEPPGVTTFDSQEESNEIDPWTKADLRSLHRAHRLVDPRSFSFWEDVAELMGERSALECRQKWFSLAKTPEPKKSKSKNKANLKIDTTMDDCNLDDDIFNSTPMRSAFAIGENIDESSTAFGELDEFSKIDVGSAFKINMIEKNNENQPSNHDQTSCPHGYKTYLQKMGRVMRQKDSRKKQISGGTNQHVLPIGKKLAERTEEGDVQVKGRLSPGGTLHVDTFGDTDTEDYLDDEAEDYE